MKTRADILKDLAYHYYLKSVEGPPMLIADFIKRGNDVSDDFRKDYQKYIKLADVEYTKGVVDRINQGNL